MNCMLVSDPGPDGENQTVTYCRACLDRALRLNPIGAREYIIASEADCEECGAVVVHVCDVCNGTGVVWALFAGMIEEAVPCSACRPVVGGNGP